MYDLNQQKADLPPFIHLFAVCMQFWPWCYCPYTVSLTSSSPYCRLQICTVFRHPEEFLNSSGAVDERSGERVLVLWLRGHTCACACACNPYPPRLHFIYLLCNFIFAFFLSFVYLSAYCFFFSMCVAQVVTSFTSFMISFWTSL